ncbi:hypothetical protein PPS11_10913 [Pseudomonas putida S11]|nr:hypothetical protein PPS11_10913 [Pseudomonas putida S11]
MQCQIETIAEFTRLQAVQPRQAGVHAAAHPVEPGTGFERYFLLADAQLKAVLDAADIADTHHQERLVEAVVVEILVDTPAFRELEAATDTALGVEQPGLVDATGAQFGVHAQVGVEGFRQEVQVTGNGVGFLGALAVLFDPAALVLAVGHHQQRAAELLIEAGALGRYRAAHCRAVPGVHRSGR